MLEGSFSFACRLVENVKAGLHSHVGTCNLLPRPCAPLSLAEAAERRVRRAPRHPRRCDHPILGTQRQLPLGNGIRVTTAFTGRMWAALVHKSLQ